MAESNQIIFSHKEVAEALIKQQGIHKGIWGVYIRFGITGANIGTLESLLPAAIVPILEIGLQRFEEETNLSVDAAKVNPTLRARTGKKTAKAKRRGPRKKTAKAKRNGPR